MGTQIINTFVTNDFGGSVNWEPRREGVPVWCLMKLRAAQDEVIALSQNPPKRRVLYETNKISDLHLHSLRTAGARMARRFRARRLFAQAAPDAIILMVSNT